MYFCKVGMGFDMMRVASHGTCHHDDDPAAQRGRDGSVGARGGRCTRCAGVQTLRSSSRAPERIARVRAWLGACCIGHPHAHAPAPAPGLLAMPPACPWSTFAPAASRFCEDAVCGWIREPANTWSNAGFLVAGIAALAGSRHGAPRLVRRFGLVCLFLGVGSAAFHATRTYFGGLLDTAGMQAAAAFMLAANARRLFPAVAAPGDDARAAAIERRDRRTFWSLAALGTVLAITFASYERDLYALEMIVAGVMEVVIVRRARVQRAHRWLAWSWATFLPGYALWWLDLHRVACNPGAHVINGHAAWHLLMAASLYFVQRFHAELCEHSEPARSASSFEADPTLS